jgi:hypothetical protein
MKKALFAYILTTLGLASAAQATAPAAGNGLSGYEQVKSITAFRGIYSWTAIDDDTLILWANAFDPYLVKLKSPSHDLRFARAIGVTQFGSQIHADSDSIQVSGFRYPIGGLFKLSREEAKRLSQKVRDF